MKFKKADFDSQAVVHLEGRDIYFFGGVFSISAMQIIHNIHLLEKQSSKPIRVFINSEGGNISDGFAIYDVMTQSKCKITTIGMGSIESMATIIFLAGQERYCYPNCRFMYHQGIQEYMEGEAKNTSSSKREVAESDMLDNLCNSIVAEKTKFTASEIDKLIQPGNFYFGAEEAIKNGFAHKIIKEK